METLKAVLNICPVPMVILDKKDKSLFFNQSFTNVLGYDTTDIPDVDTWFKRAYPNDEKYRKKQETVWKEASSMSQKGIVFRECGRIAEVTCRDGSTRIVNIFGGNLKKEYNLIVFLDMTEKEKRIQEKQFLINELKQALSESHTLRGILPFCSYCKKIRDDNGDWNQVDCYIMEHSDADISHSICPECAQKYYPDMDVYED